MHAVPADEKLLGLGEWKGVCENQPILTEPNAMMVSHEPAFLNTQTRLEKIRRYVEQAADSGERIDRVERELLAKLLEVGLMLLRAFVDGQADGDSGARVAIDGMELRRLSGLKERRYLSVFGELAIMRRVYGTQAGQGREGQQEADGLCGGRVQHQSLPAVRGRRRGRNLPKTTGRAPADATEQTGVGRDDPLPRWQR